jgi:hypothetical protein
VVHKHQVARILIFSLSNASLGAYNTYKIQILSLVYLFIHVLYRVLRVGFFDEVVLGCMIVPFHVLSLL